MKQENIWDRAQKVKLTVAESIMPGLDIGFEDKIPNDVKREIKSFVDWVESIYCFPITLWVDFEYKHYLVMKNGKRVGYIFYWADFNNYPEFDNVDDIPQIRLPVRTEHSTIEEILTSFIEAITDYYSWICNEIIEDNTVDDGLADTILQRYLNSKQ
ncbi:MAG: hypothetical protein IKS39_07430 [Clostridia bacterium]|nr:hypothetical protein [Clostridia bacterium]